MKLSADTPQIVAPRLDVPFIEYKAESREASYYRRFETAEEGEPKGERIAYDLLGGYYLPIHCECSVQAKVFERVGQKVSCKATYWTPAFASAGGRNASTITLFEGFGTSKTEVATGTWSEVKTHLPRNASGGLVKVVYALRLSKDGADLVAIKVGGSSLGAFIEARVEGQISAGKAWKLTADNPVSNDKSTWYPIQWGRVALSEEQRDKYADEVEAAKATMRDYLAARTAYYNAPPAEAHDEGHGDEGQAAQVDDGIADINALLADASEDPLPF